MRKAFAVSLAVTITGTAMSGFVISAMNLVAPVSPFLGFFQHTLFALEKIWSAAHGWKSMSHLDDFSRFYAQAVNFACPMLGFLVYLVISRPRIGRNLLTPLAIAISQITPLAAGLDYLLRVIGLGAPALYIARAILVLLLMIRTSGVFHSLEYSRPSDQLDHWPPAEPSGGIAG